MTATPKIVDFDDGHVEGAAAVLAARHAAHRRQTPSLPDIADFTAQVEQARDGATGVVAIEAGEVTGYLLGTRRDASSIWSHLAGHAVRRPGLIAGLYAAAAERWLAEGRSRHFVFVPAVGEGVSEWFRVGFGGSAVLAVRSTSGDEPYPATPGIVVREGRPSDLQRAVDLDLVLQRHLTQTPSFSDRALQSDAELLEEWSGTWEDPTFIHFVAEQRAQPGDSESHVVGQVVLYHRPEGDLRVPPGNIDLALMATEPAVRGLGAGRALTAHALAWARQSGYSTMTIDWRMTNLEAASFWPRRGFQETFLRLYRSIP